MKVNQIHLFGKICLNEYLKKFDHCEKVGRPFC